MDTTFDPTLAHEVPHHLDALLALDTHALDALYRNAFVPRLSDLTGDLRGKMLGAPFLGALSKPLARLADLPWRGKTFATPFSEERGEGVNRVFMDGWKLFRFETRVGPSRAGPFEAVQLDYDLPGNPFFVRVIKDELRELHSDLFLGQAYLELPGRSPHLALWFGLER